MKKTLLSLGLLAAATLSLAGCGPATSADTPLTISSQELDGVFNPFFVTSAPDSSVVGMTQLSMLSNDSKGNVACGADEAVVVEDYSMETASDGSTTTYQFLLKNDIKFSNGSPLTMKDVLFNLYVYLDPVYTGSSTIYSTDIVGLKAYRTQTVDPDSQDSFMDTFNIKADQRVQNLLDYSSEIFDNSDSSLSVEDFKLELDNKALEYDDKNVSKDYELALKLFEKELGQIYLNNKGTAKNIAVKDSTGNERKGLLKTDTEAFLYALGYIHFDKSIDKMVYDLGETSKMWNEEDAIKNVKNDILPDVREIITGWSTAYELYDAIVNMELSEYSKGVDKIVKNIEGIKFINKDKSVSFHGVHMKSAKEYGKAEYNEDGSCKNNEILQITINNVDPKAIWNFGFPVAPMYYYSNEEQIKKFDYESNFGVEFMSSEFMEKVIKDPKKTGVPVGAGPYCASKRDGGTEGVGSGDFHDKGIVYFEANDNFLLGKPATKKIRYKVIAEAQLVNSLANHEIDFIQPIAKPETIETIGKMKPNGIEYKEVNTSGYGYIGINASKVPSIYVRRAIMHSIDAELCAKFYGTSASTVYRSLSRESWAYPTDAISYYPFIGAPVPDEKYFDKISPDYVKFVQDNDIKSGDVFTTDQQADFITYLLEEAPLNAGQAPYVKNGNGIYADEYGNNECKITFTIAGAEKDHPAYSAFLKAKTILDPNGFEITVTTDAQALRKLATGSLSVWAAAWGSTIDPDLYQIYHMESKASSVNNWGYKAILRNGGANYPTEYEIVERLSKLIDDGRSTLNQRERTTIYADALDTIMELAVELPTYQRKDLFAYNVSKIDQKTLVSDVTSYNGLLSRIWEVKIK